MHGNNKQSDPTNGNKKPPQKKKGRRKIEIAFIEDKSRRHITFSKRKSGIMKKAYELATLTGTQVLLLVASETGHVYTFATPKLQPLITKSEGKNLIQACLNAPDDNAQDPAPTTRSQPAKSTDSSNEGAPPSYSHPPTSSPAQFTRSRTASGKTSATVTAPPPRVGQTHPRSWEGQQSGSPDPSEQQQRPKRVKRETAEDAQPNTSSMPPPVSHHPTMGYPPQTYPSHQHQQMYPTHPQMQQRGWHYPPGSAQQHPLGSPSFAQPPMSYPPRMQLPPHGYSHPSQIPSGMYPPSGHQHGTGGEGEGNGNGGIIGDNNHGDV